MDTTRFILAIVTNIIAAIIIWAFVRLTRKAKTLLQTGTITVKVRKIFTPKTITILGSSLIALFNLWILLRIVFQGDSFDRWQLLSAVLLSFLIAYWVNKMVAVSSFKANKKLEAAETRLAELEQREGLRKDRRLTPEQKSVLLRVLGSSAKGPVIITCVGNNPESNTFADDIIAVLNESGWQAQKQGMVTNAPPSEGLSFIAGDPSSKLGVILSNAFMAAGVDFVTYINPSFGDAVRIDVGIKPHPKNKF